MLDDAHNKLLLTLSEAQSLREKQLALECLMKIPVSLDHLEKLLINIYARNYFQDDRRWFFKGKCNGKSSQ